MLFNRPLPGQSVAVRTIEREWNSQTPNMFWQERNYKIVKVKEVHPNGMYFIGEEGEESHTADIIRMF